MGSHTWQPLGATKIHTVLGRRVKKKKERNAETALKQRVLSAQRGALQRGRPHPLSRLLHMRPSTPCTRSSPSTPCTTPCSERPPQPVLLHHLHQRLQQEPGELLLLLLLDEAEDEESGFCCATFDRSRTSHCGCRRVILFSLLKYFLHLWFINLFKQ